MELMKSISQIKKSYIVLGAVAAVVLVLVIVAAVMVSGGSIYSGISVDGVALGGCTPQVAEERLQEVYRAIPISDEISFACDEVKFTVFRDEIELDYDAEKTAQAAMVVGRDVNLFYRLKNIVTLWFQPVDLPVEISYDEEKLKQIIDKELSVLGTETVEYTAEVSGDKLTITNGRSGYGADMEQVDSDLTTLMREEKTDTPIEITRIIRPAKEVTVEELKTRFPAQPEDATYKIANNRITYTEAKPGVVFDEQEAMRIIEENKLNPKPYTIKVSAALPEKTVEDIKKELFPDRLGTYTTRYNAGEIGRTKNVTLATRRINDVVLDIGDTFSFNGIVGERTAAQGFADAKVYQAGEVVDGMGGGICQVSSTLYNAVLYADLEVTSRINHSLPVSYVPLGRDATVSYGVLDFRFKNNQTGPVRIAASASGGQLTVSVYGKKTVDREVIISTERVNTIPFSVREELDETLEPGTRKVKQGGSNGAVVNTYRTVKENGVTVRSGFLHSNHYAPIEQVELVGPPLPEENPDLPADGTIVPEGETPNIPPQESSDVNTPAQDGGQAGEDASADAPDEENLPTDVPAADDEGQAEPPLAQQEQTDVEEQESDEQTLSAQDTQEEE